MLPYLIGAVAVATVGAVLPAFWCPSAHARAHIQHFGAGIVTAAIATEILPEVVNETERPGWILGAFALGVGVHAGAEVVRPLVRAEGEADARCPG